MILLNRTTDLRIFIIFFNIFEKQCRGGDEPRYLNIVESTIAPIPYPDDI
jgi:hypothetical protein